MQKLDAFDNTLVLGFLAKKRSGPPALSEA